MSIQIGLFDDREVQTMRRFFAGQAMRAMLTACTMKEKNGTMPRMLSKTERMLVAAQAYLIAEEMIDAEALMKPELEELLQDAATRKKPGEL